MRRLLLVSAFVLAVPTFGEAAPLCMPDSLQGYIDLGAGGCDIGGATFSDFDSAPSFFLGATEIAATGILVIPNALLTGPQLEFAISASAGPGEITGVLIGYSVSGPPFASAFLSMTGSDATSDGVVTALEDLCLSGTFGADPTTCTGTLQSLIVLEDELGPIGPETQPFSAFSSFFDVFVDITIDGGAFGTAALDGTVTNQFTTARPVPEPTSMLLVGSGLLGLAARRQRKRSDRPESHQPIA